MRRNIMAMGMALGVVVFCFLGTGCNNSDVNNAINEVASYTDEKADVYNYATELVKDQLDAPSTAIFPTYSSSYVEEVDVSDSDCDAGYVIRANVECENMLGGRSTLDFTVNVSVYHDEGKMYGEVVSLQ